MRQIPRRAALQPSVVAEVRGRLSVNAVGEEARHDGMQQEAGQWGKEAGDEENSFDKEQEQRQHADGDVVACRAGT